MKVAEIRREEDLRELKPAWTAVLSKSASDTIFLSWEWATTWWSKYGEPGQLRILAAFDDDHNLRGIAPLRCQQERRYGQTVPALTFVGDGSNDSDYLDFIVESGWEKEVMESFRAHWSEELKKGAVLLLNEIPETSPCLRLMTGADPAHDLISIETDIPCGSVRLPESWEDYLGILRPRFRTKIRSVLRDLEGRPDVRFGFCKSQEEIERMLPILFDLHTRRWAQDGLPGVFGWDRKREFYAALSPLILEHGWLRLSWLEWNGRVLACQYGFAYRDKYLLLQEGYEPACEHWNLGVGLRAWSIREFQKEGLREYDFLGGRVLRHRSDWGAETKLSKRLVMAQASYRNLLFCRGPEWEARARESVKKLVPEKILALRHTNPAEPAISANGRNGHTNESPVRQWLRKTAAYCYMHSPLPEVARPLRDRYTLSVSKEKWPGISLQRRMEACGRIVYYHRVNDESDPFFPAMSTQLFEQEMRYLAQHYKVVSLSKLLDHLEGGSPELVVAITFDDGYKDNYQNAFPILQRYGLPATIFLTTGSVDSREPLWFERLSQAVKKTAREQIDLEIDLPRRFCMRSSAERLAAGGRIFALLRSLPEGERQQWLASILSQLGVSDEERRNKMLTWDEVRLMKARGIDFGGHTVTHPFLSKMTREQAGWEVFECKRRIEEELQAAVTCFAYPNGREEDIGEEGKGLIRGAGYRAALSTIWGMNYKSTDRMEMRRGQPWEEDPSVFAYKLDWYQLVNQ